MELLPLVTLKTPQRWRKILVAVGASPDRKWWNLWSLSLWLRRRVLWSTWWPLLKMSQSIPPPLSRPFPGTGPDHLENVLSVWKPTPSLGTSCSWVTKLWQGFQTRGDVKSKFSERFYGIISWPTPKIQSSWANFWTSIRVVSAAPLLPIFNHASKAVTWDPIVGENKASRAVLARCPHRDFTQQTSCSTGSSRSPILAYSHRCSQGFLTCFPFLSCVKQHVSAFHRHPLHLFCGLSITHLMPFPCHDCGSHRDFFQRVCQ